MQLCRSKRLFHLAVLLPAALVAGSCAPSPPLEFPPPPTRADAAPGRMDGRLPFSAPFDWTGNKIRILPANHWGLFKAGDEVTVTTSGYLPIHVFDLYGRTVYTGASPAFLQLPRGHYFVECAGDRNQFCVLPADYSGASFLGAGATTDVPWGDYQKERIMGVQWVRCWNGLWGNIAANPDPNTWDWSAMDAVVAANSGRKIIAVAADYAPAWITNSYPAGAANSLAAHLPAYLQYLQVLATRYKGRLAAIEIWNEPWFDKFGYGGCPPCSTNFHATLARMSTQAAALVKSIDPNIQIMAAGWNGANFWADTGLWTGFGGMKGVDALDWHDYDNLTGAPDTTTDGSGNKINAVAKLRRAAGGFAGPIGITELGFWADSALGFPQRYGTVNSTPAPDWVTAMSRTIKSTVLYRAAGAEVLVPQALVNGCSFGPGWNSLGGWEYSADSGNSRGPHPKTDVFLMCCYWLNGAQFVGYEHSGTLWELHWLRNGLPMTFVWSEEGHTNSWTGTNTRQTDLYGNTVTATQITPMPVIVWGSN